MEKLREVYPNPQCIREDFILLDGEWDFCFDGEDIGLNEGYYNGQKWSDNKTINVPCCYQSPRSGIGVTDEISVVWYKKSIDIPNNFKDKNVYPCYLS